MIYFFYCIRNIAGLILVISPLVGFLFIDNVSVFSMMFTGAAISGSIAGKCVCGPYCRLWTGIFAAGSWLGAFLCLTGQVAAVTGAGNIVLGFCTGALLANLPPAIACGWFRNSKLSVLSVVWAASFVCGRLLAFFMEKNTYAGMALAASLALCGLVFFIQTPPLAKSDLISRKTGVVKVFLFLLCLAFSLGFAANRSGADIFIGSSADNSIFFAGLVAGAVLSALLAEKKGISSGAVLLIFLAETAVSCCSTGGSVSSFFNSAGIFCIGLGISAAVVIIPVLLYYLCGPWNCHFLSGNALCALPAGLFIFEIFSTAAEYFDLDIAVIMIPVLILLIFAFFMIFSAWKHRLLLLKSS